MELIALCAHLVQLLQSHPDDTLRASRLIVHIVEADGQLRSTEASVDGEREGDVFTDMIIYFIKCVGRINRNTPEGRGLPEVIFELAGSPQ